MPALTSLCRLCASARDLTAKDSRLQRLIMQHSSRARHAQLTANGETQGPHTQATLPSLATSHDRRPWRRSRSTFEALNVILLVANAALPFVLLAGEFPGSSGRPPGHEWHMVTEQTEEVRDACSCNAVTVPDRASTTQD